MEILGYIKVYFSEQEKEILQNAAKEQNLAEHNGDKYIKVFLSEDERGMRMSRLIYEKLHSTSTPINPYFFDYFINFNNYILGYHSSSSM